MFLKVFDRTCDVLHWIDPRFANARDMNTHHRKVKKMTRSDGTYLSAVFHNYSIPPSECSADQSRVFSAMQIFKARFKATKGCAHPRQRAFYLYARDRYVLKPAERRIAGQQ